MKKYERLKINGPISAEVAKSGTKLSGTFVLLFGSTGVGKSNFMECITGNRDLNISGDSLESVTQEITTYKLSNVIHEELVTDDIYLIDCPGTSDNELSEMAIVKALQTWVSDRRTSPQVVLYFHRITDKRLPGSQRRTMNILKSMVGDPGKFSTWIGVVTTMWDMLLDHQVSGAEEKLVQLRRDHIGNFCGPNPGVFKFFNTQDSALDILNEALGLWAESGWLNTFRDPPFVRYSGDTLRRGPFAQPLYDLLEARISGLEQRIQVMKEDLSQENTRSNAELARILRGDLEVAEKLLQELKLEKEQYLALPDPTTEKPGIRYRMGNYLRDKLLK